MGKYGAPNYTDHQMATQSASIAFHIETANMIALLEHLGSDREREPYLDLIKHRIDIESYDVEIRRAG